MSSTAGKGTARVGDQVSVDGRHVGEARRLGEIREVMGEPGHERYRVAWDNGRESIVYAGADVVLHPKQRGKAPAGGGDRP